MASKESTAAGFAGVSREISGELRFGVWCASGAFEKCVRRQPFSARAAGETCPPANTKTADLVAETSMFLSRSPKKTTARCA